MSKQTKITKCYNYLTLIASSVLVAGCTPKPTFQMSDVEHQLMKSAISVEDSLRTLAATQEAYVKPAINTDPLVAPEGGMGFRSSIDWAGPIEPLLEKIGQMTRYRVKVLGPVPAIPLVVTITAKDRIMADILKDAGLQAGKRANVVVYPQGRVIELRYIANA